MKKATKLFSFIAIALCAFMLLGSVGNLKHASADTSINISKMVSIDKLASLDFANNDYYIEFGEYPQTEITEVSEKNTISGYINMLRSDNGASNTDNRNYQLKNNAEDDNISYDAKTGYYTLKTDVGAYPAGTKVHEYVSGLDAYYKYNNYKLTSGTNKEAAITSPNDDVRALSVQTHAQFADFNFMNLPHNIAKYNNYYVNNQRPEPINWVNQTETIYRGEERLQGWDTVINGFKTKPQYQYATGAKPLVNYRESTANNHWAGRKYLFVVEPIKWRIKDIDNSNNIILQSDLIIDSCYFNLYANAGNNYGYSYLRSWLNYDATPSANNNYTVYMPSEYGSVGKSFDGGKTTIYLSNNIIWFHDHNSNLDIRMDSLLLL